MRRPRLTRRMKRQTPPGGGVVAKPKAPRRQRPRPRPEHQEGVHPESGGSACGRGQALKARLAAAEAKLYYNELLQGNHVDDPQESGVENDYWKSDQAVDVEAAEITTLRAEI